MEIDAPIHANENNLPRVLGAGLPVLLVFWRRKCAPCDQLAPALDRLTRGYAGRAVVVKMDVEAEPGLLPRFDVRPIPTILTDPTFDRAILESTTPVLVDFWAVCAKWFPLQAAQVAAALERDAHTIGDWVEDFRPKGPTGLAFKQTGGPPVLDPAQPTGSLRLQTELRAAVEAAPEASGLGLANWNWKVVRQFIRERFGRPLSRGSCWNYLHRLGFVVKRPKKRLVKANPAKRTAFVAEYAALRAEALQTGAKIFFVDEAHFRADVELRAKWVLRGQPALVDSTSPKLGEKSTYYSAGGLESGEVAAMALTGHSTAETSVAFLGQLRAQHQEPLILIWDNGPAHYGPQMRAHLATPQLKLRLVALPGYSPDFNADEAILGMGAS